MNTRNPSPAEWQKVIVKPQNQGAMSEKKRKNESIVQNSRSPADTNASAECKKMLIMAFEDGKRYEIDPEEVWMPFVSTDVYQEKATEVKIPDVGMVSVVHVPNGHLRELNLPEGVEKVVCYGNNIKELTLPYSIQSVVCDNTVNIRNLDEILKYNTDIEMRMVDKERIGEEDLPTERIGSRAPSMFDVDSSEPPYRL